MLVERKEYDPDAAGDAYVFWINSGPFDCGMTIASGLRGQLNHESQANRALMRISPLGIFGARRDVETVRRWAMADAALTHPNPICQKVNALFAVAVAEAVREGPEPSELYQSIVRRAEQWTREPDQVSEKSRIFARTKESLIFVQSSFIQLLGDIAGQLFRHPIEDRLPLRFRG